MDGGGKWNEMKSNKIEMLKSTVLFSDTFHLLYVVKKVKVTIEITDLIFPHLFPKQEEFFPTLNEYKREKRGYFLKADTEKGI